MDSRSISLVSTRLWDLESQYQLCLPLRHGPRDESAREAAELAGSLRVQVPAQQVQHLEAAVLIRTPTMTTRIITVMVFKWPVAVRPAEQCWAALELLCVLAQVRAWQPAQRTEPEALSCRGLRRAAELQVQLRVELPAHQHQLARSVALLRAATASPARVRRRLLRMRRGPIRIPFLLQSKCHPPFLTAPLALELGRWSSLPRLRAHTRMALGSRVRSQLRLGGRTRDRRMVEGSVLLR